jgi:hypothetical protein
MTIFIICIIGNILLVYNKAEYDSFIGFNGFLLFLLIIHVIAEFLNWITADKNESAEKKEEGKMWYVWWFLSLIFFGPAVARASRFSIMPMVIFVSAMFLWLLSHITSCIIIKTKKYKENKIAKTPFNDNQLEKLEKLAILKLQDALTDEEFEELKAKILKKM